MKGHSDSVRPPAVAGLFYPARPEPLKRQIDGLLAGAADDGASFDGTPKAAIVPHAGYDFSGPAAAAVYVRLAPLAGVIERVVLLGPAHRIACRGLAVPTAGAFRTPLGDLPLERGTLDTLVADGLAEARDDVHRYEHSLEVQLPFLQRCLGTVRLLPIVVGDARPAEVRAVLERLWGGAETLVLISSDLSHYHSYDEARRRDALSCAAIETLSERPLDGMEACGARALNGLLPLARALDLRATTVALQNSGDTAGDRVRVVGYGGWLFSGHGETRLSPGGRHTLLATAMRSIRDGLAGGRLPRLQAEDFPREIACHRACFVTLRLDGALRGCIGSVEPHRPLIADAACNAWSAAFADERFDTLPERDFAALELAVSVLGAPSPLPAASPREAAAALRPGIDGVLLSTGRRQSLFLPQVWHGLPEPADFLRQLLRKAGLEADAWPADLALARFSCESFGGAVAELGL